MTDLRPHSKVAQAALAATLIGLAAQGCAFLYSNDGGRRFFANWTMWFLFLLAVVLGAMFWVAIEHVVEARWSVPLRRVPERLATLLWALIPAALLALYGVSSLYPWAAPQARYDPIIQAKSAYLNLPFFAARTAGCFLLWLVFYRGLVSASVRQDLGRAPWFPKRAKGRAAAFLVVFGVTVSLVGIDWLMSLTPHWFSTIIGVYYFAECVLAGLCAVTLVTLYLKSQGRLQRIGPDHLYNLGALLFGFTVFWAYIAYSQMMLIWYGNLPEESFFYQDRINGGWAWVSALLAAVHFLIPFAALLSRPAKCNPRRLAWVSALLLFGVALSLYWFIFPALGAGVVLGWQEAAAAIFFLGAALLLVMRALSFGPDLPEADPNLLEGLEFSL
jgi:hypothetical protein